LRDEVDADSTMIGINQSNEKYKANRWNDAPKPILVDAVIVYILLAIASTVKIYFE
jgi:hypothetical protein